MLAGSCIWGTVSKHQNGPPKVARKAFSKEEFWSPVCCHGNRTVKSHCGARWVESYCKVAEIYLFILSEENLVECMTSSVG